MLRSLTLHRLASCTLLLAALSSSSSSSSSGESRPHVAREGRLMAEDRGGGSRALAEVVKTEILGSLGMDKEPRPRGRLASHEEPWEMFQLYKGKLLEMRRGNSSQKVRGGTTQLSMTTVLYPDAVETVKSHRSQLMQWHRAVFHKSPFIPTELTPARAELRVSSRASDRPGSAERGARREVTVRVDGGRPVNPAPWTHADPPLDANVSSTRDAIVDIGPEVERWMRTGGNRALSVDVGIAAGGGQDVPGANPAVSLELDLRTRRTRRRTRRTRLPRSNSEDACDERGWCCRKSVTVSFRDIGWSDWVVAPVEYTMHFCDGTCPHNYKPASMHTQVKSRLHQMTRGGTPRPCCVPAAYEPMVLMHYDSKGKLKLTPFDDLIVGRCHCA